MDAFANLKGGIDAKRLIGGAIRVDNVKSAAKPLFDIFNLDKLQQQQSSAAVPAGNAAQADLNANTERGSLLRSINNSANDIPSLQPASNVATYTRPTSVQVARVSTTLPSSVPHHQAQAGTLARVQVKTDAASIARAAEDALLRDLQDAGVDVGDLVESSGPMRAHGGSTVSRRPSRSGGTGTGTGAGMTAGAAGAMSSHVQAKETYASNADASAAAIQHNGAAAAPSQPSRDPQPSDIFAGLLPDASAAGALAGVLKRAATGVASTAATAVAAGAGTGGALSSALSAPLGAIGAGLSSFPSLPGSSAASSSASHYAAGSITRTGGPSAFLPSSSGAWAQRSAGPGAGDARLNAALSGHGGTGGGGRDNRSVDLGDGNGPTAVTVIKAEGGPGLNPAMLSNSSSGGLGTAVLSCLLGICSALLRLAGISPERAGAGGPKALLAAFGTVVLVAWMYLMMQSAAEP